MLCYWVGGHIDLKQEFSKLPCYGNNKTVTMFCCEMSFAKVLKDNRCSLIEAVALNVAYVICQMVITLRPGCWQLLEVTPLSMTVTPLF